MNFSECCGHALHVRKLANHVIDHPEEYAGVELRFRRHLRPRDAQPLLQIFLIANKHVNVLDDLANSVNCVRVTAMNLPKLFAEVQIERRDCAGIFRSFHQLCRKLCCMG